MTAYLNQLSKLKNGLYDPKAEHDACGVGFVAAPTGDAEEVLPLALTSLQRLAHRGAKASDGASGDGAGLMTRLPTALVQEVASEMGVPEAGAPDPSDPMPADPSLTDHGLAVGVFFLARRDGEAQGRGRRVAEAAFAREGLPFYGWRPVPTNPEALGQWAAETRPEILHALIGRPEGECATGFERRLYRARRIAEHEARQHPELDDRFYIASLSSRTIVYKGLLMADQLESFYLDLQDPAYRTSFAIYHQRYSTNTLPAWERAQPFRTLAHNGEINTLQGNVNWMDARKSDLSAAPWESIRNELCPVIDRTGSDSSMLDNALELVTLSGRDIRHAAMMLVPEAWEGIPDIDPGRKAFYHFHAGITEPWDGPAALAFSDGRIVGASLDRNGLRPMRYTLTKDGLVIAGSEAGTAPIEPARVQKYGMLGPGEMLAIDLKAGKLFENDAVKALIASQKPYGEWVERQMAALARRQEGTGVGGAPAALSASNGTPGGAGGANEKNGAAPTTAARNLRNGRSVSRDEEATGHLVQQQVAFGYTSEEVTVVLRPMVEKAKDPVGSMGDDTPPAVLSEHARPLFHYFKQRFAEVTNPPIDHLRERLVFSLRTLVGPRGNILEERPEQAHLVEIDGPVLRDEELRRLKELGVGDTSFRSAALSTLFAAVEGPGALEAAVDRLCRDAAKAVDEGAHTLVLSDRGADTAHAPIPSLMATGAVHHHLIRMGLRMQVSLVVESGEPREVHHVATLLGYGASAVNPYLAFDSVRHLVEAGRLKNAGPLSPVEAELRYRKALEGGLMKVMSRMGISTLDSYTGAQVFEAVGLSHEVIDRCFVGTPSRVEGNGFRELAEDVLEHHAAAFSGKDDLSLGTYGFYKYKKDGEFHEYNPQAVRTLHKAVRLGEGIEDGDYLSGYEEYRKYAELVQSKPSRLRSLLDFSPGRRPIPLEEVEPVETIMRRFSTGNMSLGALSREAHETLAVAMNRIGGRAGSGEGGEDAGRFGTERNSNVKQIASGRFGVTPSYLASGSEIQIKMAQGSKPGEGGQVPGFKVTETIAKLRHTVPGIALISPPPHHDIYSIEDLAQLIYDMKRANPQAEVSVKLVAQSGVGIIAAGVAKGYADIVLISGHSGGTGSSPLNSIKNAGLPWEIGLAEAQQTLLGNGLRDRVALRVDGGLKTGRDVLIGALLGADQFSFGTIAMVAEGCIMARTCHSNNCPVGVASQRPELRAKFPGTPENVAAFFHMVAQEVRELLAALGVRTLDEAIGRVELLRQVPTGRQHLDRLNLAPLLSVPEGAEEQPRHRVATRNPLPEESRIDDILIGKALSALELGEQVSMELEIQNTDRTVGTTLAWEVARRFGDTGLLEASVRASFTGIAGQAFGAYLAGGMHFTLVGGANDYAGKGMAGGEIVVRPDPGLATPPHESFIVGNVVLYGATGGALYAAGQAGQRFAVRNSGALAVVEGVGDHACEYMTGGTVVVLGPTGQNFGAGMTGGEAFVLDESGKFNRRYNPQLIGTTTLRDEDAKRLREILLVHFQRTGSRKASELLRDWEQSIEKFVRAAPLEEVSRIEAANEGAMAR